MENNDIDNLGPVKLDLLVYVAIIYCLLYLIIFKGIKSSGKVLHFTASADSPPKIKTMHCLDMSIVLSPISHLDEL